MLVLAAREAEVATAMTARSVGRAAAEAAARAALAGWSTRRHQELLIGEAKAMEAPAGGDAVVLVRRLDSTLFLLEATAPISRQPAPAVARAAAIIRTVETGPIAAGFPAVIMAESEALIQRGQVSGGDACGGLEPAIGVMAPRVVVEPGALVSGGPDTAIAELTSSGSAELFAPPFVDRLATITVQSASVSPRPATDGEECLLDSINWGALSPDSPCYDHLPLVRADADLEVRGGEGRGLLVVDGDLDLVGFRFHGILHVRGRLTIGQGSVIRGALRAGAVTLLDGSVRYDACAVAAAALSGGLDGPFRLSERWWLPAF
jgi:hypothetical protein